MQVHLLNFRELSREQQARMNLSISVIVNVIASASSLTELQRTISKPHARMNLSTPVIVNVTISASSLSELMGLQAITRE
jgi:hypothetical protein